MKVLVTGAAGYIGSHVALALEEAGHEVAQIDDLSTGHEINLRGRPCVRASLADRATLRGALSGCDAVAHLAGSALVPESVRRPEAYWRNNLANGLVLVEEMLAAGVGRLVFSSTCAVYGLPARVPISEDLPLQPVTPYGASKAAFERVLADCGAAHGLRSVALRYFNAAGCHESGEIGELHDPETHLLPNVLLHLLGRRPEITVFGRDYETPDGTCVRDYVDVRDIATAHLDALRLLAGDAPPDAPFLAVNLGHGRGHSVLEVLRACERATGRAATVADGPRREGDPPFLVADAARSRALLGWQPRHDLDDMVETAWRFLQRHA